jgi:hypothetical protein
MTVQSERLRHPGARRAEASIDEEAVEREGDLLRRHSEAR